MASTKAQQEELAKLFAKYHSKLSYLYTSYTKRIIKTLPIGEKAEDYWIDNPLFNFDLFPELRERLNQIFIEYFNENMLCYKQGISDGVALAYSQDDVNLGKYTILQDKAIDTARKAAQTAFYERRVQRQGGLSLSDRVWNYAQMGKSEIETAIANVIGDGITKGTSAEELGRAVRQYLNNPDMMYRRYHKIVVDNAGHKRRVVRWYRRHIDENGKVTFKDEPLEKVGTGTYRSARMNSLRLMRTEINMAYHNANNERWQREPFVIGIRIWLSPEHPEYDICDELMGEYPKDFVFTGWHSNCLCASAPITIQGDEKKEFYRRLMDGEDMSNYVSPNAVKTPPAAWNKYIKDQHDNILAAGERGKLAYHLRDNTKYWLSSFSADEQKRMGFEIKKTIKEIADERHAKRTIEKVNMLREYWQNKVNYRRAITTTRNLGKLISTDGNGRFAGLITDDYLYLKTDIRIAGKRMISNPTAENIALLKEKNKQLAKFLAKQQRIIGKTVSNVIMAADKAGYIDIQSSLSTLKYFNADKTTKLKDSLILARNLANEIAGINKEVGSLKWVQNGKTHLKNITLQELKSVDDAVAQKITQLEIKYPDNLLKQSDKLKWEAYDFLGGNMKDVQLKYPKTWKISQEAYIKAADDKAKKHVWQGYEKKLEEFKQFKTQSSIYKNMLDNLEYEVKNMSNEYMADYHIQQLENKKAELMKLRKPKTTATNNTQFGNITQERRDKAFWDKQGGSAANDVLHDEAGKAWLAASEAEKDSIYGYTNSYCFINEPLQGRHYIGSTSRSKFENAVNNITSYINRSEIPTDMWFQRGDSGLDAVLSRIKFAGGTPPTDVYNNLSKLVGMEMQEGGFMSVGSSKGKGLNLDSVCINIFAPKGTKAAYVEPFSAFGKGWDRQWDGIQKVQYVGHEHETIFQRGTRMKIVRAYQDNGTIYLDVDIIGQEIKDLSYVTDDMIGI